MYYLNKIVTFLVKKLNFFDLSEKAKTNVLFYVIFWLYSISNIYLRSYEGLFLIYFIIFGFLYSLIETSK